MSVFAILLMTMVGPQPASVDAVQSFRAARDAGNYELAASYLTEDPRVWYDSKVGEGSPWNLQGGRWQVWDRVFNSKSELSDWEVAGNTVTAVATEQNDYFFMLERQDVSQYRITYYLEGDKISGYMISAVDPEAEPKPRQDRFDEFEAWALENHAEEWEYLRPGGVLDPTGDRAERTRKLLNEWRASVGLRIVDNC